MNEIAPTVWPGSPRASAILRPGLPTLPLGTERYVVKGGGSVTVKIRAGDRVAVTDLEGLQPCELRAVGIDGRADASILGGAGGQKSIRVFGAGAPGEKAQFTVTRDGVLKVNAPGSPMDAERQDTATDIELRIVRAD